MLTEVLTLSPRQREVARLLADGLGHKQIGHRLGISDKTVRNHIYDTCQKLGILGESRTLAIWWIRRQDPLIARLRHLAEIAVCPACGLREPRKMAWAGSGPKWVEAPRCPHEFHALLTEIERGAA